jgi:hypothetical protein
LEFLRADAVAMRVVTGAPGAGDHGVHLLNIAAGERKRRQSRAPAKWRNPWSRSARRS